MATPTRMYSDLASWFHLITAPKDYEEEAGIYRRLLNEAGATPPKAVLELGSGGGNNAWHLKKHWEMTLTDVSPQMLELSKTINSEVEHIVGDMRTLRLDRAFDAVFVHDAVSYMTTADDLRAALETAFVHCAPGGAALFAPDHVRETFKPSTSHGGHDGPDGRGLRYVEWAWDPDPGDDTHVSDFGYILREADSSVRVEHDRHVIGLFSRERWLRLLRDAGFEATIVPLEHSKVEPGTNEMFVAKRA